MQRHSTHAQPTKIIKFEVVIAQSRATVDVPATEHSEEVESLPVDNDITTGVDLSDSTNPRCWAGVETALNLILPDRYIKAVLPDIIWFLIFLAQPDGYSLHCT